MSFINPPECQGNNLGPNTQFPDPDCSVGGSGGGGVPGTTPRPDTAPAALPSNENGGISGSTWVLFLPSIDISGSLPHISYYDLTTYTCGGCPAANDDRDGFRYSYRVEDIIPDQTPTVNRIILTYRDLGPTKLTFTLTASNDDGQVIHNSVEVQIGNVIPTGALLTRFVNLSITGFRPQLTITKRANVGPVCIVAVTMKGEVTEE